MKRMSLKIQSIPLAMDLLIERDAGNEILILMRGQHQFENWLNLRNRCEDALELIRACNEGRKEADNAKGETNATGVR